MKMFLGSKKFLGFANENFFGVKKFLRFADENVLGFTNKILRPIPTA